MPSKTLYLTTPLMHGPAVRSAQVLLSKHGFLATSDIDGHFGPHSASACEAAKWRLGYAKDDIKPTCGDILIAYLKGKTLPHDYVLRQKARRGISYQDFNILAIRAKIVSNALWGIHNSAEIHYRQSRPIDGINHPYKLPLYTDCSGFVTLCYQWAGVSDPNGRGYDGQGYTGTLLTYMHPIMKSQVKIGDVVVWGSYPGHHTALVLEAGDDPLLASHGQENDPVAIRFSVESRYQPSHVTWLRLPEWSNA